MSQMRTSPRSRPEAEDRTRAHPRPQPTTGGQTHADPHSRTAAGPTRTHQRARPPARARTLWEQGRRPGRGIVTLSTIAALSVAGLNAMLAGELSILFDLAFVVICVAAALDVRPRDFFVVGVLPPLLMLATVTTLALLAREAVAEEVDNLVQAVVSGLAHHAGALVAGYALALGVLALRQVARRNSGRLRGA